MVQSKRPMLNGIVNRVAKVGIELEGGWDAPPPCGARIIRDGSVVFGGNPHRSLDSGNLQPEDIEIVNGSLRIRADRQAGRPRPRHNIGEVVSEPLELPPSVAVEEWIRGSYPQHVNDTCGLHVHMSFYHKLNYSRLMTPEFTPYIVEAISRWGVERGIPKTHMLWNRLNPQHPWSLQHCAHVFLGDRQAVIDRKDFQSRGKPHSRYTFINYCEAQHHTVECRGLPMFGTPGELVMPGDIDTAVSSVMAVVDATNRFLSKIRKTEKVRRVVVAERPEMNSEFGRIVRW